MLEVIKQRLNSAVPPTVLFVLLFFPTLWLCGMQNAVIGIFVSLEFLRLRSDEFAESTIIKSTALYVALAGLSYLGSLNVFWCIGINFVAPFLIIYLFLDEFDPTNQIPYTLALAFFQLIPVDLPGLPVRIAAVVGSGIVTYLVLLATRWLTKERPNRNIHNWTVAGLQEMVCQLKAVTEKDFDTVKTHQDKLFELNRALSRSIYGANDNLVLNGGSGQLYFPFIVVFQHMNRLTSELCDNPKMLTHETVVCLQQWQQVLDRAQALAAQNQMQQAAMELIDFSGEIIIQQVDLNYNILYIVNYLSTAFLGLAGKRRRFSLRDVQFRTRIWRQVKANFDIHSFKMRFALRLSIAVCPTAAAVYYFQLPHGFWMPMTVLVLILPYWENSLRKIIDRLVGTLLGIAVFAVLYYIFPGTAEQIVIMIVVMFLSYTTRRYAFTAIFITCSSFAINVAMNNTDNLFMLRFVYMLGAAVIAIVASYCIFPTNNAAELKNMMRRLLQMDSELLDRLLCLAGGDSCPIIKRELVLTSYLVSGKIENHCIMSKSAKNKSYVKRFIMLNNNFVTDIAHIYSLMSMQQRERIDPQALEQLVGALKCAVRDMNDMLCGKTGQMMRPTPDYHQVYDDVYINSKMLRSAECLYRMYDCVRNHLCD